jgi:AraC family transcriptional regulator
MQPEKSERGDAIGPLDWRKIVPLESITTSHQLGWVGLAAARCRGASAYELHPPALSYHRLVLFAWPSEELEVRFEGVKRHVPPPAGAIILVPAGTPARWRWNGYGDSLCVYLESDLVARVAAEAFDLDPARLTIPALDGLDVPQLRSTMRAVDAELTAGAAGGRLVAESLANILAVRLIRHILAPRRLARGPDGALPRSRLRTVVEYIEAHLDASLTLERLAAVARLSAFHFARQFKAATGLPPHQYIIVRRVERAKELLHQGGDLSLADVAASAGFSDQSQFTQHFKRLVGVTPRQFRTPPRIA